jgi:hypothetical protein
MARSSALPFANRVNCLPALVGAMGGSRLLVVAISVGRSDAQIALSVRPRAAEAVAECFSFLKGLELGEDLPCLTVDDDEWLQDENIMATDPIASSAPVRLHLLTGNERYLGGRMTEAAEDRCWNCGMVPKRWLDVTPRGLDEQRLLCSNCFARTTRPRIYYGWSRSPSSNWEDDAGNREA